LLIWAEAGAAKQAAANTAATTKLSRNFIIYFPGIFTL
jgi:hypothetical protein